MGGKNSSFCIKGAKISCLHVSCSSDAFEANTSYTGLVIWTKNGRSEFTLGTKNVKAGYIAIVKSSKFEGIQGPGRVHGPAFRYVFGLDLDDERADGLLITGFSHRPGHGFKFTSRSCTNHGSNGDVGDEQQDLVKKAVQQFWDSDGKCQNLYLD